MPLISRLPSGGGGGKKSVILADNVYQVSVSSYDNRLVINWVKPANSESPIKEYNFYWVASNSKPTSLKQFTNKVTLSNSTTSQTLTGLTANQRYWIAIESVNEDGYENASLRNVVSEKASVPYFVTFGQNENGYSDSIYGSTDGKTWSKLGSISIDNSSLLGRDTFYYTTDDYFIVNVDRFIFAEFRKGSTSFVRKTKCGGSNLLSYVNANGKTLNTSQADGEKNLVYYKKDGATSFVSSVVQTLNANDYIIYLSYCHGYYFATLDGTAYGIRAHKNYISTNGISWEEITTTDKPLFVEKEYFTNGYIGEGIVYFNNKYMSTYYYSNDGKTWIYRSPASLSNNFVGIIVFNNKLYIKSDTDIYVSDNGINNFSKVSTSLDASYNEQFRFGFVKNGVLVCTYYHYDYRICYSTNGENFVECVRNVSPTLGVNTVLI